MESGHHHGNTQQDGTEKPLAAFHGKAEDHTNSGAQGPESTTLPAMDSYDPDTCRMMEIRYTRKDND